MLDFLGYLCKIGLLLTIGLPFIIIALAIIVKIILFLVQLVLFIIASIIKAWSNNETKM